MSSSFDRAPSFDPAVLDRLRLALRDESGAFAARVITTFVRQTEELVLELERAAGGQDIVGASEAAHKLKGSAGTVGGVQLARLCDEIEHWQGAAQDLRPVVASVREELSRLQAALATYL